MHLPHGYPFLFVDRVDGDQAILGVSAGSRSAQGQEPPTLPATLLLEFMAQATLALLTAAAQPGNDNGSGTGDDAPQGLLVGVDQATFDASLIAAPPRPGDRLVARCEVRGRFGRMSKVAAWIERDGMRVATAEFLLASA